MLKTHVQNLMMNVSTMYGLYDWMQQSMQIKMIPLSVHHNIIDILIVTIVLLCVMSSEF